MLENLDDRAYLEPPDYESKAVYKCSYCDGGIYEDEEYYEITGKIYCKDCLEDNFKKYAEQEYFWEE